MLASGKADDEGCAALKNELFRCRNGALDAENPTGYCRIYLDRLARSTRDLLNVRR
jgi:hypothetical protein